MPVDDPATLEQGRRPYHPLFLPRLRRDDTPGAPFAGLWTATVPRPADRATRVAGAAAAYFADLADARTWALSAWRTVHHLAADAFFVIPAVATYTVDPQDPDAAARWEQTTGAARAAAGAEVVLLRFTTPTPQRVPARGRGSALRRPTWSSSTTRTCPLSPTRFPRARRRSTTPGSTPPSWPPRPPPSPRRKAG